jgi:hypothetical protein
MRGFLGTVSNVHSFFRADTVSFGRRDVSGKGWARISWPNVVLILMIPTAAYRRELGGGGGGGNKKSLLPCRLAQHGTYPGLLPDIFDVLYPIHVPYMTI